MIAKYIKNLYITFFLRVVRKLFLILRNDYTKSLEKNGEFWFLRKLVEQSKNEKNNIFFDVGAFKGHWTFFLNNYSNKHSVKNKIYAFEPTPSTYKHLKINTKTHQNIKVYKKALFSSVKKINFYHQGNEFGTNSFKYEDEKKRIKVETDTIDNFVSKNKIKKINLVKCDVEGYDFEVIKGAKYSLKNEVINFLQFEYNHRWIDNKVFLKDVFDFVKNKNYKIGKLCSNEIQIISSWHFELEKFYETNFVIINEKFVKNKFCYNVKFNRFNVLIYE